MTSLWNPTTLQSVRQMALIFPNPTIRPPVYDEMAKDMGHIIHKVVAPYTSTDCMELQWDDLVAECWAKTTRMNSEGLINRCRTRSEYFAQYKTAIINHVCSLVQKYIYTEKRTGVKAPPKDKRDAKTDHHRRKVEVRIDDEESGFQLGEIDAGVGDNSPEFRDLLEDISSWLNWCEQGVMNQLVSPCEEALQRAAQDAERGRRVGEPLRIRIRQEHLAVPLGMSVQQFRTYHESIKQKCLFMKDKQFREDPHQITAMSALLQFFGLQLPRNIDETVRRRALLIAARVQFEKLTNNEAMQENLRTLDIPVPELRNDRFNCFGIMYQRGHRTCENCALKEACEVKAANFGLGNISLSAKLLGARNSRIPVVAPSRMPAKTFSTEWDEEIGAFLDENFARFEEIKDEHFRINYKHKDSSRDANGNEAPSIFCVESVGPLCVRIINPSTKLKPALKASATEKQRRPIYYLPTDINTAQAINIIRAHAEFSYAKV
jgi:hypothetical protein